MKRFVGRGRAFTLIELLVVVAIIGILISILLPSLSRAREQARISTCLSNSRGISVAAAAYYLEEESLVFCWPKSYTVDNESGIRGFAYYTEFIWGGAVPDKNSQDWDAEIAGPGRISNADTYWYYPHERPLNLQLFPDWKDDNKRSKNNGQNQTRLSTPMNLPDIYKCPSDKTAAVPDAGGGNAPKEGDTIYRTWEWWGNSFPINWYWGHCYNQVTKGDIIDVIAGDAAKGTNGKHSLANAMLKSKHSKGASEFIIFYENAMNYALADVRPRGYTGGGKNRVKHQVGWHGQLDYYEAAFLDGHAEYRRFDTSYVDGPGWTTWPNKPWPDPWTQYEDD